MQKFIKQAVPTLYLLLSTFIVAAQPIKPAAEECRPHIHFTPQKGWINDPNGMVFYNGTYHLFYQYNPDSTVWGPMHWGHAVSSDLIKWKEQPIALYPDSLGTIFSGSAVIDVNNTAGFGKDAMVAVFTHHNADMDKDGSDRFQYQSLAYSLDEGKSWTKYKGNPVLQNPGIRDFRDPKVFWYEAQKKWIMTLATLDHITIYSSPDLKSWEEESKFGKKLGAHGGVWECPDLFPLDYNGKQIWVLIVNLNPGGPNGGSATQYFTGSFNGREFRADHTNTKWLDYGPDEYAGVTWSNTGNRKVFLGWMSNWQYANKVPTKKWRGAMTLARNLSIVKVENEYLVVSQPVKEFNAIRTRDKVLKNINATHFDLTSKAGQPRGAYGIQLNTEKITSFQIILSNYKKEQVLIGYDAKTNRYYVDRTNSGHTSFEKGFAQRHTAPRFVKDDRMDMTLIIDEASAELFADGGLSVMSGIFFSTTPFTDIKIKSPEGMRIQQLSLFRLVEK